MSILIKKPADIRPSEITPESVYRERRRFLQGSAALVAGAAIAPGMLASPQVQAATEKLKGVVKSPLSTSEPTTAYEHVTTYNNFYEFGTSKADPAKNAHTLKTRPWEVAVEGECQKPGTIGIEDILSDFTLEERVYRLRCVEAWSMVVPWVGISLGDLLKRFEPTANAKYVQFETLVDPKQMPGQRRAVLDWPYLEALRIDEAMHPLSILAVGLYGEVLPNQNGAPLRLVVPWKYGFKSIKSIVTIRFTEKQPNTSWNDSAPHEYGFYGNVNPEVDHPRWSQARERVIGEGSWLFPKKIATKPFNGYADQVAQLYSGLDLRRNY